MSEDYETTAERELSHELDEARTEIDDLKRKLRTLDEHFASAQYGCPDCGVHRTCQDALDENEVLRSILSKVTLAAGLEVRDIAGAPVLRAPRSPGWGYSLTPDEAALFDRITTEAPT